jgi:hypothetical protein
VTRRTEHAIVWIALAVIGLHVIDDSFLQPEPGTSAGDHLVSGLVPLALLGLAGVCYPRLRAGLRALIALIVGFLGAAAGASEAGYYTLKGEPSGDDYTGLLVIPAGLVLIGVGVMTLWTSRGVAESRRRRYFRRALIGIAATVLAFELVLPIAASYTFTHAARLPSPAPELGPAARDVTFRTTDGLRLAGTYVPSRNGAAVIAFPGRSQPEKHARMLARHGYGVLLFDRRGDGESEGDPYRWASNGDVRAAVAYLEGRPDVDPGRIGGLGLSLGGELMLETAAQTKGLKAVVSEGAGIRTIREHLHTRGAGKWLMAPFWSMVTAATTVFANHTPPEDLKELVGRITPRPIFLIYATNGLGGEELNPQFYAAAGQPKQIWEITDGGHTKGLTTHPAEYERRVTAFFDRALLQRQ